MALHLLAIGYNDISDIRNWANDMISTGITLAKHYYSCYQIKPGEGASQIEIRRWQICMNSFKVRAYLEYNRIKRKTFNLLRNDFWIQLTIGAWKCGFIPSPIVEGKEEIRLGIAEEIIEEKPQFLDGKLDLIYGRYKSKTL